MSRISRCTFIGAVAVLLFSAFCPGQTSTVKWFQPPDLQSTGIDINASYPNILADDFLCNLSGPITDLHIWGSWLSNRLPMDATGAPDPSAVSFKLSLHSDVPKDPAGAPSHPGAELWSAVFVPGTYKVAGPQQTDELFMTAPATIDGRDTQVWRYDFFPLNPFIQQQGTVYWLDVQALPANIPGTPPAVFGWKTADPQFRWNDDAVYGTTATVPFPGTTDVWGPMVYPANHPLAGQSLDLAFAVTTPEPTCMAALAGVAGLLMRRRAR